MADWQTSDARERVIVALDLEHDAALALARELKGHAGWMKVGMTLFYECGPQVVSELKELGFRIFLDLKFHDIPHQVRGAARSAALTGADLMSVHSLGSAAMLRAAREGADEAAAQRGAAVSLVGITVLTSMDQEALGSIGVDGSVADEVDRLASLAYASGANGVVCSPQEAGRLRALLGADALIVTPGVRPAGAALGDQSRVATPGDAMRAGASHVVVGRPITAADDPVAACDAIVAEIAQALA